MRRLLLSLVILSGLTPVLAQLSYRGEIEFTSEMTLSVDFPAQPAWTLAAHLEADYTLSELSFRLMLDPSLRLSPDNEVASEVGLTEAYLLYSQGVVDISAGLERLPLEYARLSLPFSIEKIDSRGIRSGVPGLRLSWFPGDWRLLATAFYQDERVTPLLSVRRGFEGFELEAFVLYQDQLIAGLGGSGLIGDIIIYGEAWLFTDPLQGRGALGLSGFIEDALWTVEGAYAPTPFNAKAAFPQLAAQLNLPQNDEINWTFGAGAGFPDSGTVGQANISFNRFVDERDVTLGLAGQFSSSSTIWRAQLNVKGYF